MNNLTTYTRGKKKKRKKLGKTNKKTTSINGRVTLFGKTKSGKCPWKFYKRIVLCHGNFSRSSQYHKWLLHVFFFFVSKDSSLTNTFRDISVRTNFRTDRLMKLRKSNRTFCGDAAKKKKSWKSQKYVTCISVTLGYVCFAARFDNLAISAGV